MTVDIDEIYRRASALDPSRPSESLRRRVLGHAADLAAEPAPQTVHRVRWRPAIFGTLAAAGLAGLLIAPRILNPPPSTSAETAAPAVVPPVASPPPAATASTIASKPPSAGAPLAESTPSASAPPASSTPPAASTPLVASSPPSASAPLTSSTPPAASAQLAASAPVDQSASPPPLAPSAPPGAGAQPPASGPAAAARTSAADSTSPGAPRADTAAPGAATENALTATPAPPPTDQSAGLWQAAETGDVPALRAALARIPIDARDAHGRTALMLATLHGRSESVDVLLAQGADPNAADDDGRTPLQAALAADQPAIAAALRRAGAR